MRPPGTAALVLAAALAWPRGSAPQEALTTSGYLALVESHRAGARGEAIDALSRWPARDLRRAALAAASDPACPRDCRGAAVLLHTEAALRLEARGDGGAAEAQRATARAVLEHVRGTGEDADFERLWFHAMGDHELAPARVPEALQAFDDLIEHRAG